MKPLYTGSDWTVEKIEEIWEVIDKVAKEDFGLDYYAPSIEIITSQQMIDGYSTHAMPILYNHWSFGKDYVKTKQEYESGAMNLAYEVVINTDPCIAYLMENNSVTLQTLVLCHAAVGHSGFFKNNYLFKGWTDASFIMDYLKFARNYVRSCEEKYGEAAVEQILDSCHALQNYGVDKYRRSCSLKDDLTRRKEYIKNEEANFNDLWRTVPKKPRTLKNLKHKLAPRLDRRLPEENILYFIEKNSPILKDWERELVRIVRKIAQYFYPQVQTKMMNEGWASFIHFEMMTHLHEKGYITEGSYLEFLHNHSSVLTQPAMTAMINPYKLGFSIFQDIKRICLEPTEEDKKWFPQLIGRDWKEACVEAMENFKDESFVLQYLSPKVIRDLKLMAIFDHENNDYFKVIGTHHDDDVITIRETLAQIYLREFYVPQLEVTGVDWDDSRELQISHHIVNHQRLDEDLAANTVEKLERLWGFPVVVWNIDKQGNRS